MITKLDFRSFTDVPSNSHLIESTESNKNMERIDNQVLQKRIFQDRRHNLMRVCKKHKMGGKELSPEIFDTILCFGPKLTSNPYEGWYDNW